MLAQFELDHKEWYDGNMVWDTTAQLRHSSLEVRSVELRSVEMPKDWRPAGAAPAAAAHDDANVEGLD